MTRRNDTEDLLTRTGGDGPLCAEIFRSYAIWLEAQVEPLRDCIRAGARERLGALARQIAVTTQSLSGGGVAEVAMQLQVSALSGSRGHQARIFGRLLSQIGLLHAAADALLGREPDPALVRVRAAA
jgi:hypothetical protein